MTEFSKATNKGALAGTVRAVPIMLGYLPIGLAFGVLASTAGLSVFSATAMSLFLFAGSAQLISVGMIEAGASVAAITMTVFLVNLRHLLMSAYLAPYLGKLKTWQQVIFSYEITDESFAVHSAHFRKEGVPPANQLFALNHSAHLAWIVGTILGAWLGNLLSFDIAAYGIDYALPAMFIALLVMQMENKRHLIVAVLAAALGLLFYLLGMSQLYIILATIIAAAFGTVLQQIEEFKRNALSSADHDPETGSDPKSNSHSGEAEVGQQAEGGGGNHA
ncbi:MAG: AzlC family ABC transporter permease [Dethiobacteria bacterium]